MKKILEMVCMLKEIKQSRTRRIIRIVALMVLFALVMALPWILILVSLQKTDFKLNAVKLGRITLQNCQLFFQVDDSIPLDTPTISIRTASKSLTPHFL